MAVYKKKHGIKCLLAVTAGIILFGFVILGSSGASVSLIHEGAEEQAEQDAASKLESYIETKSDQQTDIITAAEEEIKKREDNNIRGGDDYIIEFQSEQSSEQTSEQSESSYADAVKKVTGGMGLINAQWDSYFVGYIMKTAGTDITAWNAYPSVFATKIHKQKRFSLPDNHIPNVGEIVFFGKPLKALSDSTAINAMYCGIVSEIETVTEGTTITAMRITVIEPDTDGGHTEGNYDHRTSHIKKYVYDLYDTKGTNHHGSKEYEQIIGYGTVITDRQKEISAEPSDVVRQSSEDILIYKIELRSTYEDAKKENETP